MRKLTILFVLLLIGGIQVVFAQSAIKGKVTSVDDSGGIPGASVVVVGTNIGTITDFNGLFSLAVPANAKALRISFVGMKTIEIQIGSKKEINVTMESETTSIEEVVAVGYGVVKKSDLTGAVSSVKGDDLTKLPTMRADQALQGRAAGISVQNTDGEPGGNVTIRIRGGNSATGGNDALVVIDGMQGGNLSTINPNDIASVEVLKDASATAIYGARGANGVILITSGNEILSIFGTSPNSNLMILYLTSSIDLVLPVSTASFIQTFNLCSCKRKNRSDW